MFGIPLIIRRLHDSGKNAWWFLTIFFPILILIFAFFKSDKTENKYGKSSITEKEDLKTLVHHFHS